MKRVGQGHSAYWISFIFTSGISSLPTKQAVFFYGAWQDAMINHLDLSAMLRFNVADSSRLPWMEVRAVILTDQEIPQYRQTTSF